MRHGAWSGCFSKAENAPATETGVGTVLWKTSVSWSWLVANRTQEAPQPQYFSLGAVPSSTHWVPPGKFPTEEAELLVSPGHCAISRNGRLAHLHSLHE